MDEKHTGPAVALDLITNALKRGTSALAQFASAIDLTKDQFESINKADAEARLKYFFRMSALRPKGFRTPSRKHGPAKQLTAPDKLLMAYIGPSAMPKGTRSLRKAKKAERYQDYLEAVRNNPQYPTGDRRAK